MFNGKTGVADIQAAAKAFMRMTKAEQYDLIVARLAEVGQTPQNNNTVEWQTLVDSEGAALYMDALD